MKYHSRNVSQSREAAAQQTPSDGRPQEIPTAVASKPLSQTRDGRLVMLWAFLFLGIVALLSGCGVAAEPIPELAPPETTAATTTSATADNDSSEEAKELVATFAGGCFWCTESVFERMEGVNDVVSGYIGGAIDNPNYKQVCSGRSGHAEAVAIYYDPSKVTYEEMLEVFFKTHDPTTLNRQGPDYGTQYRSSVFYHDDEQKKTVEKYIKKLNDERAFKRPVVTQVERATKFYAAEEEHQDFFRRNPGNGYCRANALPKIRKFNRMFKDKVKKDDDEK